MIYDIQIHFHSSIKESLSSDNNSKPVHSQFTHQPEYRELFQENITIVWVQ